MIVCCRFAVAGFVGLVVSACGQSVWAQRPILDLLPFRKIEADPHQQYRLAESNGPWLVMAATFSGEGAERQAHDLVVELRRDFHLEAYTHEMTFDFSNDLRDPRSGRLRGHYHAGDRLREVAVLVGNFPTVDDGKAEKTLQTIKYATPATLDVKRNGGTTQNLSALRRFVSSLYAPGSEQRQKGPMGKAFLTTNPMLPKEYFAPKGIDKLVEQMNDGVQHSLLDNPARYTVLVATFKGSVVLKQDKIREIENGKRMKSKLADAAWKAHRLTEGLRAKGYDAYEFHDRHASMVTVGSFNSPGLPRADGKIEINPQADKIIRHFKAKPAYGTTGGLKPERVAGIVLDIQPMLVEVPKRAISTDYARGK